jgi:hypothetical protein
MCSSFNVITTVYDNNSENSDDNNSENSDDSIIIHDTDIDTADTGTGTDTGTDTEMSEYSLDYDTEEGIEYDSIHREDAEHFYIEKEHNNYYIGLCHSYFTPSCVHYLLLSTSVSARTFFNHPYKNVNNYLYYYGLIRVPNPNIQIMQLKIHTFNGMESYNVIIKTYWLRLIQRHWKKIYKKRSSIIKQRIQPNNQQYKSIHGNYPLHISNLPSLSGMLSIYQNSLDIKID